MMRRYLPESPRWLANKGRVAEASRMLDGIADICLVPQMFSADRFGIDTSAYPRLRAVRAACEALPAFAEAAPGRQPDAV